MWCVQAGRGLGEQQKIVLSCSDADTGAVVHAAEVYLFGATITSYIHNGDEKIFLSPSAIFNGVKAIRGGVPVVFPQFGQPFPSMLQHGFARNKLWQLSSMTSGDASAQAIFQLISDDDTIRVWPHRFSLTYTILLTVNSLKCDLHISCLDEEPFLCQALLHTYLNINDISSLGVTGFNGLTYIDKVRGGDTFTEGEETRLVQGEIDRVYVEHIAGRIPDIEVRYAGKRLRVMKGAAITRGTGIDNIPTDVVFWNPWEEKSVALSDMVHDGYKRFVCVEPGVVQGWTEVSKDSVLQLYQEIVPEN